MWLSTSARPAVSAVALASRDTVSIDIEPLIERTRQSARKHGLKFELTYRGEPVYTPPDSALVQTALQVTGTRVPTTVAFGTDGVAFVTRMKRLIVLGPGDIAQAHTADEWIGIDDLRRGVDVYARLIDHFCIQGPA